MFLHRQILPLLLTGLVFAAPRQMENLDRGLVAVKVTGGVYVGWRVLGTDAASTSFNLYRGTTKVNASPVTGATNLLDAAGALTSTYTVRPIIGGVEQPASAATAVQPNYWKSIPITAPAGGTLDATAYTYTASDASAGDLDGDGKWDLVFKWDPTNAKDNSQSGMTGNVYLDGVTMAGKKLFRIDLGVNIRAGAHYTQFVVADFDGDGKAEIICKTAPGTKDGKGNYLSKGPAATDNDAADYRATNGYILTGPEYLTVFRGSDGAELATVNYVPGRGTVSAWGDNYGNRVDRFLATAAWLDGVKPSAVMQRGYYTRMTLTAWDWNGTTLSQRWAFDSKNTGSTAAFGQGNHNLSVGDVDGDGKDEIIEGACTINDDGTLMYTTGLGHGDAIHLGDLDPTRPGLEVWDVHEDAASAYRQEMHDARTGAIIWGSSATGDNGRGMAGDIDANSPGYEMWSASFASSYSPTGAVVSATKPNMTNFRVYWDGDLQDELLDGATLNKWNGTGNDRLETFYKVPAGNGATANNGTKATPNLVADLNGDWREEVVYHTANNDSLLIFSTTTLTNYRLYTLMHDPVYRAAISWQNAAYNQPPHLGFFLGSGVDKAPVPNIILVGASSSVVTSSSSVAISSSSVTPSSSSVIASSSSSTVVVSSSSVVILPQDCSGLEGGLATLDGCGRCIGGTTGQVSCLGLIQGEAFCSADGVLESTNLGFLGTGYLNGNNAVGALATFAIQSNSAQVANLYLRYANAGIDPRQFSMKVNGIEAPDLIVFDVQDNWMTWGIVTVSVTLAQGLNQIDFTAITALGAPNLDLIGFGTSGLSEGTCALLGVSSSSSDVTQSSSSSSDLGSSSDASANLTKIWNTQEPMQVTLYNAMGHRISTFATSKLASTATEILRQSGQSLQQGRYIIVVRRGSRILASFSTQK